MLKKFLPQPPTNTHIFRFRVHAMSNTFATISSTLRGSVRHCSRTATGGSPDTDANTTHYIAGLEFYDRPKLSPRFGSRHRRRYSFKKMIVNNKEQRMQYVYLVLSGVVASALLAIVYISLWTTADEYVRESMKAWQLEVNFIRPTNNWQYNNTWQYIGDNKYKHQIYSAYFDLRLDILDMKSNHGERPIASFRVLAILPRKFNDKVYCILRYDDFRMVEVEAVETKPFEEAYKFFYSPYSIMCPFYVEENVPTIVLPTDIAIAYKSNWMSHSNPTFVPISYPRNMTDWLIKSRPVLSVCLGPLFGHYDNALRIVEFVELYRIMGAQHFYFYLLDVSRDVKKVIDYYVQQGLATILNWNIAREYMAETHYAAIMGRINECAYRAMIVDNYRYVNVVDLDEVLVPYKHNSLSAFLRQCDEGRTSAFVFRNVFFYKKDSNDEFSIPPDAKNRMLYTQTKVRRILEPLQIYSRSKYIANTRAVIEAGNHQLWRTAPGFTDTIVHPTVGLSHHYRDKCINCKNVLIVDYSARRFGSLIWQRVDDVCLQVFLAKQGICPVGWVE